jgi:uncharacterized protein (DUF433 family)
MGKVAELIEKIKLEEGLTIQQVFEKYPHLVPLQKDEMWEEYQNKNLTESKKKDLLLD